MANITVDDLPTANGFSSDDLFIVLNDPAGVPGLRSIAAANLFGNITIAVVSSNTFQANGYINTDKRTPANGTITSAQGRIWFDDSYLYVTTSNNVTKRVALSAIA